MQVVAFAQVKGNATKARGKKAVATKVAPTLEEEPLVEHLDKSKLGEMKFVGIPMNQTKKEFIYALQMKGYQITTQKDEWNFPGYECVSMKGTFWKFDNCDIRVKCSSSTDLVSSVLVKKGFYTIYRDEVHELMDNLNLKYGERFLTSNTQYGSTYRWISDKTGGMIEVGWMVMSNAGLDFFSIEYFSGEETEKQLNEEINAKKKELDGL